MSNPTYQFPGAPQQQAPQAPKKKPGKLRIFAFVLFGLAALVILISLFGGGDDKAADTATTAPAQETAAAGVEVTQAAEQPAPAPVETEAAVPTEYKSALRQAETYVDYSAFSYAGLYDQLTSEYGGQFSAEAAQYAVDNVGADWNAEALEAAITYQETMALSPAAIYDQLVSEYGGQFTPEQAQYAVDNLPA